MLFSKSLGVCWLSPSPLWRAEIMGHAAKAFMPPVVDLVQSLIANMFGGARAPKPTNLPQLVSQEPNI